MRQEHHPGRKPRLDRCCRTPSLPCNGCVTLGKLLRGSDPRFAVKGVSVDKMTQGFSIVLHAPLSVQERELNSHCPSKLRLSPKLRARGLLDEHEMLCGQQPCCRGQPRSWGRDRARAASVEGSSGPFCENYWLSLIPYRTEQGQGASGS